MSDHCIVCAEPLQFTAYGPCGHNEACSNCICRLRSVLKDPRCVYCQQPSPAVFVTHYAGDFTRQIPPQDFSTLQERASSGEFYYLESAQAYFDDQSHFKEMQARCSYSHPLTGNTLFRSLKALKTRLLDKHERKFCDICLEGRKVFISEQITYKQSELDRHMKHGDLEGPMAVSGFSGHPECVYCRKRFYGSNELYEHMHRTHEQCFLCKRADPSNHVYYRNYSELEGHFRKDHYICEQRECLEKGFVVFPTEQELKTHTVKEHSQNLSKAEKKAALTLPMHVNYRRGNDSSHGASSSGSPLHPLAAVAASGQRIVMIGGAASIPSQFQQQQHRRGSNTNHTTTNNNNTTTTNATMTPSASSSSLSEQQQQQSSAAAALPIHHEVEFPSIGASSNLTPAIGGRWAGGGTASGSNNSLHRVEDFPALPGTSKSAKKRAAAKKKTAAQMIGGGGSIRVVNNNNSGGGSSGGSGSIEDQFPSLKLLPSKKQQQQSSSVLDTTTAGSSSSSNTNNNKNKNNTSNSNGGPSGSNSNNNNNNNTNTSRDNNNKISEALRAANRALIEKIKQKLGNDTRFAEFRQNSTAWLHGQLSSSQYHTAISNLGLASLVPDLAATCPNETKREELLSIHATAFDNTTTIINSSVKVAGSWVPPEAAAAAAQYAAENSSWTCGVCTLVNAPMSKTCEACGGLRARSSSSSNGISIGGSSSGGGGGGKKKATESQPSSGKWKNVASSSSNTTTSNTTNIINTTTTTTRPSSSIQSDAFPALSSGSTAPSTSGNNNKSNGKSVQKGKQSLSSFYESTRVHPQNPWKNPNLKGEWASGGGGSLAKEQRAMNDAWSKQKKK